MAETKFKFVFSSGEVVSSSVHKSGGYSYASVSIKRGDSEYISLGYEWKGDKVPDLAMDILGFMAMGKDSKESASVAAETKAEVKEFLARLVKECL